MSLLYKQTNWNYVTVRFIVNSVERFCPCVCVVRAHVCNHWNCKVYTSPCKAYSNRDVVSIAIISLVGWMVGCLFLGCSWQSHSSLQAYLNRTSISKALTNGLNDLAQFKLQSWTHFWAVSMTSWKGFQTLYHMSTDARFVQRRITWNTCSNFQ